MTLILCKNNNYYTLQHITCHSRCCYQSHTNIHVTAWAWNSLPSPIQAATSLITFLHHLSTTEPTQLVVPSPDIPHRPCTVPQCQYIFNKWWTVKVIWHKAASPPHTDGSVVFARWCQSSNTYFLRPTQVHIPNGILISSAVFAQLTAKSPHTSEWAATFPHQNYPFQWRSGPPPKTWFLGPTQAHNPKGISISSAIFAGFTIVIDRPTVRLRGRPTDRFCL